MKLIHIHHPDQVTGYASGLIIEGYRRSIYKGWSKVPRWYRRIDAVTLLLHVTIGKPRPFMVDFGRRTITAKPMYWLRCTFFWPFGHHAIDLAILRVRFITRLRRSLEVACGVMPDDR